MTRPHPLTDRQTDRQTTEHTDTVTSKGDYGYLEPVLHKTGPYGSSESQLSRGRGYAGQIFSPHTELYGWRLAPANQPTSKRPLNLHP